MKKGFLPETAAINELDRQIIQSIQTNGRAPFALIADVIGVSEQTVARRYRRMESAGVLRVYGLGSPEALGVERWMLRIQCRPDAAGALANALARRSDVRWVSLSAGGSEVVCSTSTHRGHQGQDLLLNRLPKTAQVQALSAHAVMHQFESGGPEWSGYGALLTAEQVARLAPTIEPDPDSPGAARLTGDDATLLESLGRDGRASLRQLGADTGWSPVRVGRRIDALLASGAIYLDVDLDLEALGFTAMSHIWVTVAPHDLEATGQALSRHTEVAFCAAVTGSANIVLAVVCRDSAALYRYVTTKIGALQAVRQIEVSPMLRRVKQAGSLT